MELAFEHARQSARIGTRRIADEGSRPFEVGDVKDEKDGVGIFDVAPEIGERKASREVRWRMRVEHGLPGGEVGNAVSTEQRGHGLFPDREEMGSDLFSEGAEEHRSDPIPQLAPV